MVCETITINLKYPQTPNFRRDSTRIKMDGLSILSKCK